MTTSPMDTPEGLLACPFCGKFPEIEMTGFHLGARKIFCGTDDCMGPHTTAACMDDAVVQWNRRAIPTPAQSPVQEALDLAVNIIMAGEPGDSRAVSNEAVALAAVACGDTSDAVMQVVREALAVSSTHQPAPALRNSRAFELANRLEHAVTTMQNDDLSEPQTEKRARHVSRCEVMFDVIEALRSPAPHAEVREAKPVAWIACHESKGLNFATMATTQNGAVSNLLRTGIAGPNHGWGVIALYDAAALLPQSERGEVG